MLWYDEELRCKKELRDVLEEVCENSLKHVKDWFGLRLQWKEYNANDEHPKQELHNICRIVDNDLRFALLDLGYIGAANCESSNVWIDDLIVIASFEFLMMNDSRYFIASRFEQFLEKSNHKVTKSDPCCCVHDVSDEIPLLNH
jgi:hypothetical protein